MFCRRQFLTLPAVFAVVDEVSTLFEKKGILQSTHSWPAISWVSINHSLKSCKLEI